MSDVDRGIETAELSERRRARRPAGRFRTCRDGDWLDRLPASAARRPSSARWRPAAASCGCRFSSASASSSTSRFPPNPRCSRSLVATGALAGAGLGAPPPRGCRVRVAVALAMIVAGATMMTLRTDGRRRAGAAARDDGRGDRAGWPSAEASARGGARVRVAVHDIAGVAPERHAGGGADHGPQPGPTTFASAMRSRCSRGSGRRAGR